MYKKFPRAFGAVTADSAPAIRFCPSNPPILPDSAVLPHTQMASRKQKGANVKKGKEKKKEDNKFFGNLLKKPANQ